MITYTKRGWGLGLIFRTYGSAIPRSVPVAFASAALAVHLNVHHFDWVHAAWSSPFPYQLFGTIVGFIVVFRAQWAHERYIAGRDNCQTMTARWADACAQALSFDEHTCPSGAGPEWREEADRFQKGLVHLSSLLHALALQHLRGDWDLDNLVAHNLAGPPPPLDASFLDRRVYGRNPLFDLLFIRATTALRTRYNEAMPLAVVGGTTSSELDMLTKRADPRKALPVQHGTFLTNLSSGVYMAGAGERVNVVMGWIYARLSARRHAGGLNMDAPILANIWTRLADGYQAFEQCRMLVDTPFPWPWAQLLALFLVAYAVSLPVLITAFVDDTWVAAALTFLAVLTYWSTNEVARDLEDPFVYDPNDLPLARLQYLFNERLVQTAAGIMYDKPQLPDIDIPAEADPNALPQLPQERRGRRGVKRRGIADVSSEPLIGDSINGSPDEYNNPV